MGEVMETEEINSTDIIIPAETLIQEQVVGTLLTTIPKQFHQAAGISKGAKLCWKLKQREDKRVYLVCWIKDNKPVEELK